MLCIPVLQLKLAVIIAINLHLEEPGIVFQTINTIYLIVKEWVRFIIFFSKCLYNTNKILDLICYLSIDQRAKISSSPDVPLFYNHIVHELMNNFIRKNDFLHLYTLSSLYWASKKSPASTVLSLGLANIFYWFWLKRFFKRFTAWNTRFNLNRINIFFFTCKVCIVFIPFVGVTTWSIWLMMYISRTKLFNIIMDSIQGLILFLIILEQLNQFLSKALNLNLQSTTIQKIRPPIIFQVFRKKKK